MGSGSLPTNLQQALLNVGGGFAVEGEGDVGKQLFNDDALVLFRDHIESLLHYMSRIKVHAELNSIPNHSIRNTIHHVGWSM